MERGRMKGFISAAFCVLLAAFSVGLYLTLIRGHAAGALMYSLDLVWLVVSVSLVCAFLVFLVLSSFPKKEEDNFDEADYYEGEEHDSFCVQVQDAPLDEYPELFVREGVAGDLSAERFSYRDAVQRALDSQRASAECEDVSEKSEAIGDPLSELYGTSAPKEQENFIFDSIYNDLPDTLPEGYVSPEEEECEDEEEEEIYEEEDGSSFVKGAVMRVLLVILLSVVPILTAYVSSYGFCAYYEDRVEKRNAFFTLRYEWSDSIYYEVAPSFFGDSLSVTFTADDGADIELMPSSLVCFADFYEKYSSVYSFAVDVCEKMDAAGAKKQVKERNTIEGKFTHREDIGEYVEKLIELD